jgi:uncharacterized Zn-binding protein involved in type VI secretion
MPAASLFDVVTLRAVDNMAGALVAARARVAVGGWLVTLTGDAMATGETLRMPHSAGSFLNFEQV